MTSSHHGPYGLGYTRATMVGTEGRKTARWSKSQKTNRSPDWSLQLDSMKSESLVIANQHVAVNTFPENVLAVATLKAKFLGKVQHRG